MRKLVVSMLFALMILSSCNKAPVKETIIDIASIQKLSKLTTLECRFNNVAVINKETGKGITHFFEKERKLFFEYEGVAKIGVDFEKVQYDEDSKTMLIPKPIVISINDVPSTYNMVSSKDSFFNKNEIEDEEIKRSISDTLKKMEDSISSNKMLMNKAQMLAKSQIENLLKGIDVEINYVLED